ncbi:hypothetical protein PybrP1_000698 [[Pythium] brassicae (nom. inval.)]|nr:hypothetical protein PybrP1_000698 [[Pythium] brassicae (nom. inval.)]
MDDLQNDRGGDDDDEHFPTRFASWEHLMAHVREFAEHAFQAFRVRSTVSVRARNAALAKSAASHEPRRSQLDGDRHTPRLPDAWRFYSKTYACTHGLRYAPSERRRQKPAPLAVRASGCTARVNASVAFDRAARAFYVRAAVRGQHNHPLGREQFYSYVENRRITDPALLALVTQLEARGERVQAIYDAVVKHVEDATGAECVFQLQDVRNVVLRLQTERRKRRATVAPASPQSGSPPPAPAIGGAEPLGYVALLASERVAGSVGESDGQDPESEAGSDEVEFSDDGDNSSRDARQRRGSKRPFRTLTRPRDLLLHHPAGAVRERMPLSRLEMFMDSGFCFELLLRFTNRVDVAAIEAIPGGITKFKHSVVAIPAGFQTQDVDFVLPRYVADGCEKYIVEVCQRRHLFESAVGVSLSVQRRDSRQSPSVPVVLTLRQVRVMKRYYHARELMRQVRRATRWLNATSFDTRRPACAPFDDCFNHPKELFTYPARTMPLLKVSVSGVTPSSSGLVRFADFIYAPNLLKLGGGGDFGPDPTAENVDTDCVKAVLLHMHARFYSRGSVVCPAFVEETDPAARRRLASLYGAFVSPGAQFTAGVVPLPGSARWGGFYFDRESQICHVFTARASESDELQTLVSDLWRSFGVQIECRVAQPCAIAASPAASAVLALYFVELMLYRKSWTDVSVENIDYLRCRYMLHALQVVSKQDVHLIQLL